MFQRKEFERVTPESVGIKSETIEWLLDQLEGDFTEPHGLIIMRHGKICGEGWWSPYAPGIRHGQQSHSKTYAATAVGIAYTEGLLTLDEKVIDIFPEEAPEHPSENLKKLTVKDVLCMGCGMDTMPVPTIDWIQDFLETPVNHEPGTTYMYNSVGSTLLGAIVRKKTGLGLHAYLKPRLYDKIGIFSDNHIWLTMPDGMEIGGGGLYATTEDNLRLMKLYADGGMWEGERILSEDYVRLATTLQNESATEALNNPSATDNFLGYGFQIWMCQPEGVYRADGAMGQFTIVVPAMDMIIAITENASGAHWAQKTLDVMWDFLDKIANETVVCENPIASEKLKRRMSRLALPRVRFAPYSSMISEIDGKVYKVKQGKFSLDGMGFGRFMSGIKEAASVKEFCFVFEADRMLFNYSDGEKQVQLTAALDGSRRWNSVGEDAICQALASGAWIEETVFELTLRWIETCNEQKVRFSFEGTEVKVTSTGTMMGAGEGTDIVAKQNV